MTLIKRKKVTRQRGQHTHGWGAMKKHRGAGNRGGVGNAGSGKRGDAKKPRYWKNRPGKYGFTSAKKSIKTINLIALDRQLPLFIEKKIATKKENEVIIDLTKIHINKLLGSGSIKQPVTVIVDSATQKAQERIASAGGKVVLPKQQESPAEKSVDVSNTP